MQSTPTRLIVRQGDPVNQSLMNDARQIDDAEESARICGLISCLALPQIRRLDGSYVPPALEVLVQGTWRRFDRVAIDDSQIVFMWGINGSTESWSFDRGKAPAWRSVRP